MKNVTKVAIFIATFVTLWYNSYMKYTVISKFNSNKIVYNHIINSKPKELSFPKHQHDYIEILYFLRGNVTCFLNGKEYKLKPYDIIIVRPYDEHYLLIEKDVPYERYSLHIKEKLLPQRLLNGLPKQFDTFQAIDDDILTIFMKFDKFYKEFNSNDLEQLYASLAVELFYLILLKSRAKGEQFPTAQNPLIEKALTYIKENLTTITSIDEICNNIFISKRHFYHLFCDTVKDSPMNFINNQRLNLAKSLIEKGEKPTKIYVDCGYTNYSTFYRAYKAKFGYKPNETIKKER